LATEPASGRQAVIVSNAHVMAAAGKYLALFPQLQKLLIISITTPLSKQRCQHIQVAMASAATR
jgi:hypothetical protein